MWAGHYNAQPGSESLSEPGGIAQTKYVICLPYRTPAFGRFPYGGRVAEGRSRLGYTIVASPADHLADPRLAVQKIELILRISQRTLAKVIVPWLDGA